MPIGSVSAVSSTRVTFDVRDLNRDGKVSEAEIQAYLRAHPDPAKVQASGPSATESAQGQGSGTSSLLDITV